MSFYIYYGKLDDELLVTVLPNGTIESGDPIHLFTQQRYLKLAVKEVSTSSEGEDLVSFRDGLFSYKAVPKKGYKELDLTIKGSKGKSSQVTLTRHYNQPVTAILPSNPPQIWIGTIDFHDWAKHEAFIVVAPMGLGNEKPIIALWQWTKDDKGVARTLSYSTDKQVSAKGSPGVFSFKQGGYYTLNCKVNDKTNGLNVTIKGPTNAAKEQKELLLSAKVELSGEHQFAPPRGPQQKIEFDCSYPRPSPSLPRITGPLPFPDGLAETLRYSAAYLDQAGYLAQHAVKNFNDLEKAYRLLDNKAEARGATVSDLTAKVTEVGAANALLTAENTKLKQQLDAAGEAQKNLQKELREALKGLAIAKVENDKLNKIIAADKIADKKLADENAAHDKVDHETINSLEQALAKSQQAERHLQRKLEEEGLVIAALLVRAEELSTDLVKAKRQVCQLETDLNKEKKENQKKLDAKNAEIKSIQGKLDQTKTELAQKLQELSAAQEKLEQGLEARDAALEARDLAIEGQRDTERTNTTLHKTIDSLQKQIHTYETQIRALDPKKSSTGTVKPVTAPKAQVQTSVTEIVA